MASKTVLSSGHGATRKFDMRPRCGLSGYTVFDTRTFEIEPPDTSGISMYEPLVMSPGERSIVRRGGRYPALVIVV